MLQAIENDHMVQEHPMKKQVANKPDSGNSVTRENKCSKKEIEAQKALIEN